MCFKFQVACFGFPCQESNLKPDTLKPETTIYSNASHTLSSPRRVRARTITLR